MDFTRKTYPHFHQAAVATALTLSVLSPAAWSAECSEYPAAPLTVNITGESEDFCDDQVSLREAIHYANDYLVGKDAVTFASTLKGKTIEAVDGQIVINESITISGFDDVELITLKANNEAPLFSIESPEDRIDFDLSHVILEKQAGSNHIIEMDGYGGDIVLDDIQTNEVTHAGGIFDGYAGNYSGKNDLNLTLKNSSLSGSIFEDSVLTTRSWENRSSLISIENTTISSVHSRALASTRVMSNENAEVRLINSTISGGSVVGALLNSSSLEKSLVSIIDSKIHNIESYLIAFADSDSEDSMVEFQRAIITGNTVEGIAGYSGYYDEGVASIEVSESTISSNTVTYSGLYASGTDGTVNIKNSVLCNNVSPYGGDIAGGHPLIQTRYGTNLEVFNSNICNNQVPAINISTTSNTTATIENSSITNNHSTGPGAGIYASNGGKGSNLDLNIINSSISGNKSETSGGGISVNSGEGTTTLNIENSTISNNHAGYGLEDDGLSDIAGGGIVFWDNYADPISASITNSTISHNFSHGVGGGIGDYNGSDINISNSIIAKNISKDDADHDLFGSYNIRNSLVGDLTTNDWLIISTSLNGIAVDQIGISENQTPDTGNNIFGQDPLLQDLSLSGGTWVHQLSAGSPAISAGNALTENLPEFDQRGEGFARVRTTDSGPELDLGAVQYFSNPVAVNDAISVLPNSENNLIDVVGNDEQNSDGLPLDSGSVTIMLHPENGIAEILQDGTISYTPTADFVGTDSLTYVMQDIAGGTSTEATVSINVSENSADSADSGGTLNLWVLSLLALFGLRRRKPLKSLSK